MSDSSIGFRIEPIPWPIGVPEMNHAVVVRRGGMVETNLSFDSFFNSDHTIMVRFYPFYYYGYAGPILANSGRGVYMVGIGDYFWPSDGRDTSENAPGKVFIQIGNTRLVYDVLTNLNRTWQTLAVVRSGNSFSFHFDSHRSDSNLRLYAQFEYNGENNPEGNLRLGRRADLSKNEARDGEYHLYGFHDGQFYGLIDDVAVFRRALTEDEMRGIIVGTDGDARLTGEERDLAYGLSFDVPGMSPYFFQPPPILRQPYVLNLPSASLIPVTYEERVASFRYRRPPLEDHILEAYYSVPKAVAELPFQDGQVWKVGQGFDAAGGTHKGLSNFCWDFNLVNLSSDGRVNDVSSDGQVIYAPASGRIMYVKEDTQDGSGTAFKANFVLVKFAEGEFYTLMHIKQSSFTRRFNSRRRPPQNVDKAKPRLGEEVAGIEQGSSVPPQNVAEWRRPWVEQGEPIAEVGDTGVSAGNHHLHFAFSNMGVYDAGPSAGEGLPGFVTIPVAFSNYWASGPDDFIDGRIRRWHYVPLGVPIAGQLVNRRGSE